MSQRAKDRLTGAAVALFALLIVAALLLWWVTEPTDDSAMPPPQSQQEPPQAAAPPPDLAEGETWLSDLVLEAGAVETSEASLRDVTAQARDVRNTPTSLEAGWLSVDATVPFEVVAAEIGDEVTVRGDGPSRATVVRDVDVLGRELRVVATGTVEVVSGRLVVEPRSIDIGGPDFLSRALGDLARALVTIEHDVEGLPDGLVLQDVTVQDDGFRANLQGEDVRLVS